MLRPQEAIRGQKSHVLELTSKYSKICIFVTILRLYQGSLSKKHSKSIDSWIELKMYIHVPQTFKYVIPLGGIFDKILVFLSS